MIAFAGVEPQGVFQQADQLFVGLPNKDLGPDGRQMPAHPQRPHQRHLLPRGHGRHAAERLGGQDHQVLEHSQVPLRQDPERTWRRGHGPQGPRPRHLPQRLV